MIGFKFEREPSATELDVCIILARIENNDWSQIQTRAVSDEIRRGPANTKYLHNIYTTSAQRLRRWPNVV